MKRIFFLTAALLLPFVVLANEIAPKPTIKEVIVYLDGAQIVSEVSVSVSSGKTDILFAGLSPKIDPNSIQISGLQEVTIASVNYTTNYLEKKEQSQKIKSLEIALETKQRAIALLRNQIQGLQEEESLLHTNKKIHTEQQSASVEKVEAYANYYRQRITKIKTETYDANKEIENLNEEVSDINNEIAKLKSNSTERRGEIKLVLDAPRPTSLTLTLKYNVSDAGWFPTYDIKAENTQAPIALHYKANVYQDTGEDWSKVKLTLSSGNPTLNTEKPIVDPHYLNFVNPYTYTPQKRSRKKTNYTYNPSVKRVSGTVLDDTGLPLPGVNILVSGTNTGTQTDFDGNYVIAVEDGKELTYSYVGFETETLPIYAHQMNVSMIPSTNELQEVVVTAYGRSGKKGQDRFKALQERTASVVTVSEDVIEEEIPVMIREENVTNVLFKINKPYSIPTSPTELTTVEIDAFDLEATYEYYSAPLLVQNVFLTAKIKEWENFDILSGEAKIYFAGNFAGSTYLNPQQTEEELVVSLGIDPAITVERKQMNNHKSKSFFGNTRIVQRNYEITLRNNKSLAVEVTLLDRVPISQNKEIKLENATYEGASIDEDTGIVTWKVNLNSRQTEKRTISYEVKYPKGKHINLN